MSSGPNHRRGEERRQDNGPTWEGGPPSSGCNSTHVAKTRRKWRDMGRRAERRTGRKGSNGVMYFGRRRGRHLPSTEEQLDDMFEEGLP